MIDTFAKEWNDVVSLLLQVNMIYWNRIYGKLMGSEGNSGD